MQEIMNACAGFAREAEGYALIDQAGPDRDSVSGVRFRAVALGDGGRRRSSG
jgi:hypothetical protein